jgi:hypothetical protein
MDIMDTGYMLVVCKDVRSVIHSYVSSCNDMHKNKALNHCLTGISSAHANVVGIFALNANKFHVLFVKK